MNGDASPSPTRNASASTRASANLRGGIAAVAPRSHMNPSRDTSLREPLSALPAGGGALLRTRRGGRVLPWRGIVALSRARLRSARGGRLGTAVAVAITLIYGAIAFVARAEDSIKSLEWLLGSAARWLSWAAVAPI